MGVGDLARDAGTPVCRGRRDCWAARWVGGRITWYLANLYRACIRVAEALDLISHESLYVIRGIVIKVGGGVVLDYERIWTVEHNLIIITGLSTCGHRNIVIANRCRECDIDSNDN